MALYTTFMRVFLKDDYCITTALFTHEFFMSLFYIESIYN